MSEEPSSSSTCEFNNVLVYNKEDGYAANADNAANKFNATNEFIAANEFNPTNTAQPHFNLDYSDYGAHPPAATPASFLNHKLI